MQTEARTRRPLELNYLPLAVPYDYILVDQIVDQIEVKTLEQEVCVQGTVDRVKKQGKVGFLHLQGQHPDTRLQVVVEMPDDEQKALLTGLDIRKGSIVRVTGVIQQREGENIRSGEIEVNPLATFELTAAPAAIEVVVQPETQTKGLKWQDLIETGKLIPADYGEVVRMPEFRRILLLRGSLQDVFIKHFVRNGFSSIDVPALTSSVAESGAEVFRVIGGGAETMSLIQSPQQIKQLLAAIFGKVVWCGSAFRNDPSDTTLHLSEFTGMDIEMQIQHLNKTKAMSGIMIQLQEVIIALTREMQKHPSIFADNSAESPIIPSQGIPVITYQEGLEIAGSSTMNRETEQKIGQFILEKTGSDFCFVTDYPESEKPFYTDSNNISHSFDLLLRGTEIASGGLRIADVQQLKERIIANGYDLRNYSTYLDSFYRGTAQTGGFGLGLERFMAGALGGISVRFMTLFPKTSRTIIG